MKTNKMTLPGRALCATLALVLAIGLIPSQALTTNAYAADGVSDAPAVHSEDVSLGNAASSSTAAGQNGSESGQNDTNVSNAADAAGSADESASDPGTTPGSSSNTDASNGSNSGATPGTGNANGTSAEAGINADDILNIQVNLDQTGETAGAVIVQNGLMYVVNTDGERTVTFVGWNGTAPQGTLNIPATVRSGQNDYSVTRIEALGEETAVVGASANANGFGTNANEAIVASEPSSVETNAEAGAGTPVAEATNAADTSSTSDTADATDPATAWADNPYINDYFADADKALGVTSIAIPASVASIDLAFFQLFPNVARINVAADNTTFNSTNGMLFNADQTNLLLVPEGMEGAAVLPVTLASVPACAFTRCTKLSAIVHSQGSMSSASFATRNGILYTADLDTLVAAPAGLGTSANVAAECTTIAEGAFWGNADLDTIIVNGNVATIDALAFDPATVATATVAMTGDFSREAWEAVGFTKFTKPLAVGDQIKPVEGSGYMFTVLDDFTLAAGWWGEDRAPAAVRVPAYGIADGVQYTVSAIAKSGFAGQTGIVTVDMPETVTTIGAAAFAGCTNLQTVNFTNAVTVIGEAAFQGTALRSVVLPSGLARVGAAAFGNLRGTTVLALTDVRGVFNDAFAGSTGMSVYVPMREDGDYALSAGLPASGNHVYPYGVKLSSETVELEEGGVANLNDAGYIEAPGEIDVEYKYSAKSISVDTESGEVEGKQIGNASLQATLTLTMDYVYVKDIVANQVKLRQASFTEGNEGAAANSGLGDVIPAQLTATLSEGAVTFAVTPRVSTADVGPFSLPTTTDAGNADANLAGWSITAGTLSIWSAPGVKVRSLGFTNTSESGNDRWKRWLDPSRSDCITSVDTTGLHGVESMYWWFRDFGHGGANAITDVDKLVIPSEEGMVPTTVGGMLYGSTKLESIGNGVRIPYGVVVVQELFASCTSLKTIPEGFYFPTSVTIFNSAMRNCYSLEYLPAGFGAEWSSSPVIMGYYEPRANDKMGMFTGCKSLKELPAGFTLPNNISNAHYAFSGCTSLKTLPASFKIKGKTVSTGLETMFADSGTNVDTVYLGTSLDDLKPDSTGLSVEEYWKNTYSRILSIVESDHMGALPTTDDPNNTDLAKAGWSVIADVPAKEEGQPNTSTVRIWSAPGVKLASLGFTPNGGVGDIVDNASGDSNSYWKRWLDTDKEGYITRVDTSNLSGATSMHWWFRDFGHTGKGDHTRANYIDDVSRFYVPDTPGMVPSLLAGTFYGSTKLKNLEGMFKIPDGVTSLGELFASCSSLETLGTQFIPSKSVTSFNSMFRNCTSLVSLPEGFGREWSDKPVSLGAIINKDHQGMFMGCISLKELPAGFTLPKNISKAGSAFENCKSLKTLPASFDLSAAEYNSETSQIEYMFNGPWDDLPTQYMGTSLDKLKPKHTDLTAEEYWLQNYKRSLTTTSSDKMGALPTVEFPNNTDPAIAGWSVVADVPPAEDAEEGAEYTSTLRIWSANGQKVANLGFSYSGDATKKYWKSALNPHIENPVTAIDTSNLYGAVSMQWWFRDFIYGEQVKINDVNKVKIPETQGMTPSSIYGLFYGLRQLENINGMFSVPDGVVSVGELFGACVSLKSLPEGFNFPTSCTNFATAFRHCKSLEELPVGFGSKWASEKVALSWESSTDHGGMFMGCSSLKSLPDGFTLPENVSCARYLFEGCTSLTTLPSSFKLSGITFSNPANIPTMFIGVTNLDTTYAGTTITALLPDNAPSDIDVWTYWKTNYDRNLKPEKIENVTATFNLLGEGNTVTDQLILQVAKGSAIDRSMVTAKYGDDIVWYEDEGCTQRFNFATKFTADKMLYAKGIVTLSWESNGGTAQADTTHTYKTGVTVPIPSTPPTRIGYTFLGWYTALNGGIRASQTPLPLTNTTYYAHWAENSYIIHYRWNPEQTADLESAPATDALTYSSGTFTVPSNTAAKCVGEYYTQWYTPAAGGGKTAKDASVTGVRVFDLIDASNSLQEKQIENNDTDPQHAPYVYNIYMYPDWKWINYTINYDYGFSLDGTDAPTAANGASGAPVEMKQSFTYEQLRSDDTSGVTISKATTAVGYTFTDWNSSKANNGIGSNGNDAKLTIGEAGNFSKLFDPANAVATQTVTLTAKWTEHTYKVELYDYDNDANHETLAANAKYHTSVTLPSEKYIDPGYKLGNWQIDKDSNKSFAAGSTAVSQLVAKNSEQGNGAAINLYANQIAKTDITYTVKFFYEDVDGRYSATETSNKTYNNGVMGGNATLTDEDKTPTGTNAEKFVFDDEMSGAKNTADVAKIKADGTTAISAYFRMKHTVTYKVGTGGSLTDAAGEKSHTVCYDHAGGAEQGTAPNTPKDGITDFDKPADWHYFTHWSSSLNAGASYLNIGEIPPTFAGDVTYTANFDEISYKVNYDGSYNAELGMTGTAAGSVEPLMFKYSTLTGADPVKLAALVDQPTGYMQDGWVKSGSSDAFAAETQITADTANESVFKKLGFSEKANPQNNGVQEITLKANWKYRPYRVKFWMYTDTESGANEMAPQDKNGNNVAYTGLTLQDASKTVLMPNQDKESASHVLSKVFGHNLNAWATDTDVEAASKLTPSNSYRLSDLLGLKLDGSTIGATITNANAIDGTATINLFAMWTPVYNVAVPTGADPIDFAIDIASPHTVESQKNVAKVQSLTPRKLNVDAKAEVVLDEMSTGDEQWRNSAAAKVFVESAATQTVAFIQNALANIKLKMSTNNNEVPLTGEAAIPVFTNIPAASSATDTNAQATCDVSLVLPSDVYINPAAGADVRDGKVYKDWGDTARIIWVVSDSQTKDTGSYLYKNDTEAYTNQN